MLQTFEYLAMDEVISRNSQSADSKGIQWGSSLESQKWSPGADYSFRRAHVAYMFAKAMMSGNVPDESLDKLVKRCVLASMYVDLMCSCIDLIFLT